MAQTRVKAMRIPGPLIALARKGMGASADMPESDVVRGALAIVAGVDVADYTPRKTGGPRGPRRPRKTT